MLYSFFNLDARWGRVVNATPRPLYPRERPGTNCIGGWVGPQGRSGQVRKISPPPGFDPRTVQPVASRLYRLNYRGPRSPYLYKDNSLCIRGINSCILGSSQCSCLQSVREIQNCTISKQKQIKRKQAKRNCVTLDRNKSNILLQTSS